MRIFRACAVLLAAASVCLAAGRMDGTKFHELTAEYATPHLPWADALPGGRLKALFVVNLDNARLVVETAQRMPLDFEVVTTAIRFPKLGITADEDSYHGALYTGTSHSDKCAELLEKLDRPFEVLLVASNDLAEFPARAKLKILQRVRDGAGLVLCNVRGRETIKAVFASPDPAARQTLLSGAGLSAAAAKGLSLDVYSFGRGRIVVTNSMAAVPHHFTSLAWYADFENGEALLIRTLLHAAGRTPRTSARVAELETGKPLPAGARAVPIEVAAPGAGRLTARLRDGFNTILRSESFAWTGARTLSYRLPALRTGRHFLDLIVADEKGVDDIRVVAFDADSGVSASLAVEDDSIRDFDPIRATLSLNGPRPGGRAVVSLVDSPYGRVWYRRETVLPAGERVPVEVRGYRAPTLAAFLRVEVFDGAAPLALAETPVYFPVHNRRPPVYYDYIWEYNPSGPDRLRSMAENDVLGYAAIGTRIDGDRPNVQNYMLLNQRLGGHYFWVGLSPDKQGAFAWNFAPFTPQKNMSAEENAVLASMNGRYSIGNPNAGAADRILVRSGVKHKELDRYPMVFYGMGNETGVRYEGGFGPEDAAAFTALLKKRYGSVGRLNAEWGRSFKSFEEVPNMPMEEARVKGLYPEYLAHRRLVDETALTRFAVITDEARKADPFARLGCDGTWALSNGGMDMERILLETQVGYWEQYNRLPRAEILRSLRPEIAGFVWGWTMPNESYPEAPWFNGLIGTARHGSWFISGCSVGGQQLAADYRPFRPRMAAEMERFRTGPVQLLNTTPLQRHGLAVWYNYVSDVAGLLGDPRLVPSNDSVMPLISFCYQRGITFDFICRAMMAEKAGRYRTLFLAGASSVGEEEERLLERFVEEGGTIVADINPGVLNDSFAFPPENRLARLFGRIDASAKPVAGPVKIETALDGRRISLACASAAGTPGVVPFSVRTHGKGRAILLNFTLASVLESAGPAAFERFMLDLLAACGVEPTVASEGLPAESILRVREGNGFLLAGVTNRKMAFAGRDGAGKVSLRFPARGWVYEVGRGAVSGAPADRVEFTLAPPFRLFTVFPERQNPPPLRLSAPSAAPGVPVALDLSGFPAGRVLHLQVRDAAGRPVNPRSEAVSREVLIVEPGRTAHEILFPFNAEKGVYEVVLTDVATGLSSKTKLPLT